MPFDLQPILKGQRIQLRPLRAEDFRDLYTVAPDPLTWELHPARDRYQLEVFRSFFKEAPECGGALVATDAKDGKIIGSSEI